MSFKYPQDAAQMIQKTVWNLRVDAAWLGSNSCDEAEAGDTDAARVLETASRKIRRVADAVERLVPSSSRV
jgi:hypothetical protein